MLQTRPAEFGEYVDEGKIRCRLCPAECLLTEGKVGICGARSNQNGSLVVDNYGQLVTLAMDPIEKKPLYHFYPTSSILSTGANGCNFKCINCQNWSISQAKVPTRYASPESLVRAARDAESLGVAFTYTEPTIWYEYIMDCAPLLREAGLKTVLVSNGYVNPEPLDKFIKVIDAINIDLKGIRPEFYKKVCKGKIEPILTNIRQVAESPVHLELTNLIIPTLNDSDEDLIALFDFVQSVSDMIPIHLSAYHPDHKLDIPGTSAETMLRAHQLASERLKYVYVGNMALDGLSNTTCHSCGALLIERTGYSTGIRGLDGSRCRSCKIDTGIVNGET